jgi:hypothetical protein
VEEVQVEGSCYIKPKEIDEEIKRNLEVVRYEEI